ncbi:unnamed protein product [Mucor circinelloides]
MAIPQATAANKAVMALKAAIPPKPCANKKRKSTNLEIDMNFERVKPTCVASNSTVITPILELGLMQCDHVGFASLITAHRKLKEELKETIRRHSLISLDATSLDQIAQTLLLFPVPEEVHVAVTSFVQLTLSLASNNQQTTVLRGQRNKSYLEFAEKLTNLNDNQQAWLRQHLKQHYGSEHVDQSFKDDTGAALYLSPRFFFNRILVVPHAEWNEIKDYLETQKKNHHVFNEIDFETVGGETIDYICTTNLQDLFSEEL